MDDEDAWIHAWFNPYYAKALGGVGATAEPEADLCNNLGFSPSDVETMYVQLKLKWPNIVLPVAGTALSPHGIFECIQRARNGAADPLANRAAVQEELAQVEDPFAALAAFAEQSAKTDLKAVEDLLTQIDDTCASLSTVCYGFLFEEVGASCLPDDKLQDKGVKLETIESLAAYLHSSMKLDPSWKAESWAGATFAGLVAAVDASARRQKIDVANEVTKLLVPLSETSEAEAAPSAAPVAATPVAVAPPSKTDGGKARPSRTRGAAVEKGIRSFQGMTLRGRTPDTQSKQMKEAAQKPVQKANVIL